MFDYNFWIWKDKLNPILDMFCLLVNYELMDGEREAINLELQDTNSELNNWGMYILKGTKHTINIKLAYDDEKDLIYFDINTSYELKEKIECLDFFQGLFKELITY